MIFMDYGAWAAELSRGCPSAATQNSDHAGQDYICVSARIGLDRPTATEFHRYGPDQILHVSLITWIN